MSFFEVEATRFQTGKERFNRPSFGIEFKGMVIGQGCRDDNAIIVLQAASTDPQPTAHQMDASTAERGFERQMSKERGNMNIAFIPANGGIGANAARKVYAVTTQPLKPPMTDKLTVCGQTKNLFFGKYRKNTLHQGSAFFGGRISALRQERPDKRVGRIALHHRDH